MVLCENLSPAVSAGDEKAIMRRVAHRAGDAGRGRIRRTPHFEAAGCKAATSIIHWKTQKTASTNASKARKVRKCGRGGVREWEGSEGSDTSCGWDS